VFQKRLPGANFQGIVQWFEGGGELKIPEGAPAAEALKQMNKIPGLADHAHALSGDGASPAPASAAASEFVLEGLWSHKRISRSEERGFFAERPKTAEQREPIQRPPRRQYN
jgi:magnesium chelatase subunit I